MIAIDREKSINSYAYKLLDGVDIKIKEEAKSTYEGDRFSHIYYVESNSKKYLFGGKLGQPYKSFLGFETTENKVAENNLFDLYEEEYNFNFEN
ncbi:MAG: hypothetical protein ACRCX8_07225 [Sarcina sp.]